jgi:alanyl-tRNA synthetase
VIGDHVRAVVHMIADGIAASNVGRGYILRRLIRRVVRHGRLIGIEGAFINKWRKPRSPFRKRCIPMCGSARRPSKPNWVGKKPAFWKPWNGAKSCWRRFSREASPANLGEDAFVLYDTYGFPLELTQEIAEEQGLTVDAAGFEAEMEQQRQRSKDAHETIDLTVQGSLDALAEHHSTTAFWAIPTR